MSDGLPSENVFDQQDPLAGFQIDSPSTPPVREVQPSDQSPLDGFEVSPVKVTEPETSTLGAAARGAERGALPATGSLAAAGAGAELGGAAGEAFGPVGALVGGVAGGIGGALAGGKAVEAAQNWLLSKLPSGFVDAFGLDEKTERLDQQEHPVASFVGGLVPYAVTMRPGPLLEKAALPENATALQRLMTNPVTARLFGGGVMGGMELTGELEDHENLDWRKIGIATGFGIVFNRPNKFGEAITERGAGPVRAALGRPSPTIAQAGDLKVVGPGITEQVFQGTQEQAPQAAMVAQETARAENPEPQEPDVGAVARRMEPELFGRYDELVARQTAFRDWINEYNQPSPETFAELQSQKDDLQAQLDQHVASRGGYTGGAEARKLRAQIRDVQREHDELTARAEKFAKGEAEETADLSMARQHLLSTEFELRDLQPQIAAAYRRAADTAGTETLPAEPFGSFAEMLAAHESGAQAPPASPASEQVGAGAAPDVPEVQPSGEAPPEPAETQPAPTAAPARSIADQRAFIANDVARRLIAAGRPADEANAVGQIKAAYYITRAARFEGKLGSAENLYAREDSAIAGPSGKALAPAQPPTGEAAPEVATSSPPPPMSPQEALEYAQTANGKIRFRYGKRPVTSLFEGADASTPIHEGGHEFLEQMKHDAAHPEAPDQLKKDFQTVKNWLGIGEDGTIKTRQHEKFARGFEQYMREGVAPSKELARVFAQFRNWLLQIYKSIKGLGKEISPEIRDVFDRMLEMEPQRTVIAPERAKPDLLHDIHEVEARTVEPHEAEATGDRIAAEKTRYIADQAETAHEIQAAVAKVQSEQAAERGEAAQPAGETGATAGRPSALEPGGAGSESEPGGGAGREEHGEVERGGGAGVSEGASDAAGPDLRSKLGDNPGTALAPGPVDLFGPRESPLVDKAGNIRLDNLNVPEDVAQAIRVAAGENNDFIGDRRGVITDGQVLELADALGMDAETLNRRQLGQAFNAEQIWAARKLLVQSATRVAEAMKKAATGTDADVMAYAEAKDRHQMIQAQVAGITAEAGRALRAFRSMAGMGEAQQIGQFIQQATGKTLYQLRAEARLGAELKTPQQVSKMMHDATKNSFGRMVLEYWINGLISGPATHMTYAVGNTISSLLRIPEQYAASGVSHIALMLGREGTGVRPGEAGAMFRAGVQSLPAALKAGVGGLKTGLTTQLPGETAAQGTLFQPGTGVPAQFHEGATYHDAMGAAFGLIQGMRDGIMATGKLLAAGGVHGEPLVGRQYSPLGAIPDITYRGVNVLPVGSVVRAPGRLIAAIHSFYRAVNFSMEKAALAYRQAASEGLEGEALAARVAQLRSDPSEATMNALAAHEATQTTLMGKGSELTQALSRLTNTPIFGFPLLKFVDPFVHISGNIIEQAVLQRTPVGLLSMLGPETELARDLRGANGNAAQDKAIGRMLMGTALSMTFGGLAAQGLMSGSGPKDPKEAAMWRLAGNQAHSVRIGEFWYDVHRLGPLGMLAGISADLFDVAHQAEQGELLQAAAHLQHAFTQNILDESFMRGPADLIQAVEDPGRFGEAYIRNFLSSFVPFSVGVSQIARASDPYTRRAQTLTDAIKAKIPGLSESLLPRRDIWGEPMPSREVLGAPGVSAIYMTRMGNDPVNKAMLDLNIFPAPVSKKIRNVELSPQEYDDYARIAGRLAKPALDKIVRSPAWNEMPVEAKRYAVQHTIEAARETASGMVGAKYPHIYADATRIKHAKARGEKPQ